MDNNNNYEILPHQLIEDLKYDVESLKKKLSEPDAKTNELILEIETLKDSIHDLNGIFKQALEETKEEDIYKSIATLNQRIDDVVSQNETIAKGMIAISDKLEEFMSKPKGQSDQKAPVVASPLQQGSMQPSAIGLNPNIQNQISGMPPVPPIPNMNEATASLDQDSLTVPPLPKKRRGFFK